ncbi:MAG: helix-turn-helix transcriptional regulator [Arcobacter sp.]|uniref:helix-turn-helix domain-containing protein n=1 Tax=Arcobacter sp. TaxID=1872629 RepID=UPI0025911737|nr:helix-turn-helix transcriptional regulator [Arcobacter sp.]MDD3008139.1 helix-turn-helix transcriptional regulator [Arcobacter sp.]MDY3204753.1 helix-turn-helix transcriptional regulator [Arcobacter sp.]
MKLYEIGQQIKTLREAKKLTQEQLASKCGISRVTLGKVERGELGNTSVKTLDIILASLGLEIEFKTIQGFGLPSLDEL